MMEPAEFPSQEETEIERIRRNRRMTTEELLSQHDEALRSMLECMRAAESAKIPNARSGSDK